MYAFGAKFDRNLHKLIDTEFGNTDGLHGIHDIHLNQGNVGAHAEVNGVFHDGGLLLAFPDRVLGLLLAFQTQRIPTDATGAAAPGAHPLSQIVTPGGGPGTGQHPTTASVYLERALINPIGPDPGHEAVAIGNLATDEVSLHGWRLVDRNGNITKLDAQIAAGASEVITLDGTGAQLGNIILQDESGTQVDTVTYSADDAADRYVRFQR